MASSEPFPSIQDDANSFRPENAIGSPPSERRSSIASRNTLTRTRTRTGSLIQSFIESNPPLGMWQATGEVGSKIPTLPEIRNGSFAGEGWTHEGQMEHRGTNPHEIHRRRMQRTSSASTRTRKSSITTPAGQVPAIAEEHHEYFPKRASISVQDPLFEVNSPPSPEIQSSQIPEEQTSKSARSQSRGFLSKSRSQSRVPGQISSIREPSEKPSTLSSAPQEPQGDTHTPPTGPDATGTYPNGYRFPKKHTWLQSTTIGLKAFWKFFLTPFGFIITIYGLNVVGWGAMIFFVLLKAAPAMCHPSCEDDSSARQKWIEIDSQILNGLFCVTAFGLFPWRARDFYYLLRWRWGGNYDYYRRLAGINRSWYRLPGSDQLPEDLGPPPVYNKKHPYTAEAPPPYTEEEMETLESNRAVPLPATSMPEPPLTGIRAKPTPAWTIDFVVWMYMLNTFFQVLLCIWMWHWNRFDRPTWGTGVWITLGCLVAIFAGVVVFIQGNKIKKVEGIPVHEYDVLESIEDFEERKAKEEKKDAKKEAKRQHRSEKEERKVIKSHKLKGDRWFERH
ncbi:hypothetical protein PV10_08079 [Exophiala mesophila]|uniref:Alpha-l-rhamnosidase c protein n=1 Tax=Exophiala mesophila TaxID=212818 RepID=A0A0D1ZNM0_EXOME|nr:uncharacterized protein PV10_08079 [Exophiala mesophila]KIV88393.1 hypothetical protein PV10_08079 [Exophiala mesophila]